MILFLRRPSSGRFGDQLHTADDGAKFAACDGRKTDREIVPDEDIGKLLDDAARTPAGGRGDVKVLEHRLVLEHDLEYALAGENLIGLGKVEADGVGGGGMGGIARRWRSIPFRGNVRLLRIF